MPRSEQKKKKKKTPKKSEEDSEDPAMQEADFNQLLQKVRDGTISIGGMDARVQGGRERNLLARVGICICHQICSLLASVNLNA